MLKRRESRSAITSAGRRKDGAVAVLSDVHGNLAALDAVLDDVGRRGIGHIVHLGDAVYGPLDPRGAAARMIERDIVCVRGNEDRLVASPEVPSAAIEFVRAELRSEHLRWLAEFSLSLVCGDLFLCHGTPHDDATYLLLDASSGRVRLRNEEELAALVAGVDVPNVLCGHDHLPRVVRLESGLTIFDPGSVGCPAYADDAPAPHRIENGSPHARYAVLTRGSQGWRCEHVSVVYDWHAASALALRRGRKDWAAALATGRVARADFRG